MKSLNILKCIRLVQTNKLVISLQKHKSKDGPVLSCAKKYWFRAIHHLMLKPFPLQLGEADPAVSFDILNFIITNDYYCNNLTVSASLRVSLFFPAAYMP